MLFAEQSITEPSAELCTLVIQCAWAAWISSTVSVPIHYSGDQSLCTNRKIQAVALWSFKAGLNVEMFKSSYSRTVVTLRSSVLGLLSFSPSRGSSLLLYLGHSVAGNSNQIGPVHQAGAENS